MSLRPRHRPIRHPEIVSLILAGLLLAGGIWAQEPETGPGPVAGGRGPATEAPEADLTEAVERIRAGAYAEAEDLLAALQPDFPDDPALLLMRGEVLLALGRPQDALEVLRHGAEVAPERPRMNFQLGTALASSGQRKPALEAYAREIEHNSDPDVRVLAHLNRSLLLQQERRWNAAAQELEAVLQIQPERKNVYGDLASLYIQAGDAAAAVEALERGEAVGFSSAEHYYSLGARLYKSEMFEQAVVMLGEALRINPGLAEAERSLAASLEQLGREADALEHLRRYLELRPDAPDAPVVAEKLRAAEKAGE